MKKKYLSIRFRLICIFLMVATIIIFVNVIIYNKMNASMNQIDHSYVSNKDLVVLQDTLENIQSKLTSYLYNQHSDDLNEYYRHIDNYKKQLETLNDEILQDKNLLLERNIKNISFTYIEATEDTIKNKNGRNIAMYQQTFSEATKLYTYLYKQIYLLNNSKFEDNTKSYSDMLSFFKKSELLNIVILIITIILCVILILFATNNFIAPLKDLVKAANKIGEGNLDIEIKPSSKEDEINVVIRAFNKMVVSLQEHINKLKESMALENEYRAREILMESHLKDSQLKCLQAQINPHFLFNTLNAGAQLAMLEDANSTYKYIHKVADFFRYNVKKDSKTSTLGEEIELVDNYIYILNVRFSGDIHYKKDINTSFLNVTVPCMFLQPIVENCIKHGFSSTEVEKNICLTVTDTNDYINVCVSDTGIGMSDECITSIFSKDKQIINEKKCVGITNVCERLRLYYNKNDVMTITSDGYGKGTKVSMYIYK